MSRRDRESLSLPTKAMLQRILEVDEGELTAEEEKVLRLHHGIGTERIFTVCPEALSPLTMAMVLADFAAQRRRFFLH